MNCDTSKDLMMKYFDGEMDEAEEKQFREHLKTCSGCRDEFSCMEAIFASLDEKVEIEPPDDFEARVMDKVALIEKQRRERSAKRIVWLYNLATMLSIILLLIFVADIKDVSIFSAFERIGEYFGSFSTVTAAISGAVKDLLGLLANALSAVADISFSIVRSYYYAFIVLILAVLAIQRLIHYVGTHTGEEAE
ncbi:MAG TPA: anti-sigma factor [Clostridiales bacterium]|nr:anti-sigma factor [Clostridiales bacterium]HPV02197.1 anti-sigma factor [Clostridiales bacterium]